MIQEKFQPQNPDELLAFEIASAFKDMGHLSLYLKFCQRYEHNVLLTIFGEVKETDDTKIRKSKGALFTYLVNQHAKRNPEIIKAYSENQYGQ